MAHSLLRAALAVLLASSFVFALSADDVARFYLKSGESLKVENLSISSTAYSVVKIDGVPSIVLAPSGATFEPVTDRAVLMPVVEAYSKKAYAAHDFQKSVQVLNETASMIETVLGDCDVGGAVFLKSFPSRSVRLGKANLGLKYLIFSSATYKSEQDGYLALNASFPAFDEAYRAFIPSANAFSGLVAAGDANAVLDAASTIRDSASVLKARYAEVSTGAKALGDSKTFSAILNFTFYDQGEPHSCYPDGNGTAAVTRVQNEFSDQSLQSATHLADSILAVTSERASSANTGAAYALRTEEASGLEKYIANLSAQFNAAGYDVVLKALIAKKDVLKTPLASVNSTGSTEAFDAAYKDVQNQLLQYQSAYSAYASAAATLKKAGDNVTAAQKKYGEADGRMAGLNKDLTSMKTNMSSAIALLSSGDAQKASAQFTAISAQASDLGNRAGTLPAQGNQLDLPIVGGVVVLVLVLAGTVWYFRKMKQNRPKTDA